MESVWKRFVFVSVMSVTSVPLLFRRLVHRHLEPEEKMLWLQEHQLEKAPKVLLLLPRFYNHTVTVH